MDDPHPAQRPRLEDLPNGVSLRPGDVLLSFTSDTTGKLIAGIDGGSFCHAALYAGEGRVIESVPDDGVRSTSLDAHLKKRDTVVVYRHRDSEACGERAVAIAQARVEQGQAYGLSDVMFQAFIVLRKDLAWLHGPERDQNRAKMLAELNRLRDNEGLPPRRATSCTQLVASAFFEAAPSPTYALRFLIEAPDDDRAGHADELLQLSRELVVAYAREAGLEDPLDPARGLGGNLPGGRWPLYMVSAKDLETSPTLTALGFLKHAEPLPPWPVNPPQAEDAREAERSPPSPDPAMPPDPAEAPHPALDVPPQPGPPKRGGGWHDGRRPGPCTILFVGSSPRDLPRVNVDTEYDVVLRSLQGTRHRDDLYLERPLFRPDLSRLSSGLRNAKPDILHFAGHGEDDALLLLDLAGDGAGTQAADLLHALEGHDLALVTLNACNTDKLARELAPHVGAAIGFEGKVKMSQAVRFAEVLFEQLGAGRTLENAFNIASSSPGPSSARPRLLPGRADPRTMVFAGERDGAGEPEPGFRPWRRAAMLGAAGAGTLLALLLSSSVQPAAGPAPTELRRVTGQRFTPGSTMSAARAAYERCRASYHDADLECRPTFDLSVFAREVELPPVTVSDFMLERHEVTTAQFAAFLNRTPEVFRVAATPDEIAHLQLPAPAVVADDTWLAFVALRATEEPSVALAHDGERFLPRPGYEELPMRSVSHAGAAAYCESIGRRLPTSEEWELAAGGAEVPRRLYPWGDAQPNCHDVVFARGEREACASEGLPPAPAPVGARGDVTPEGIFDLGGNVSEWTSSTFDGDDSVRVVRGGGFEDLPVMLETSRRFRVPDTDHRRQLGFRCARDSPPPKDPP